MAMDSSGSEGHPGPGPESAPGQSLDLPVRTASAPAPKQGLTGKQEHCSLSPPRNAPGPLVSSPAVSALNLRGMR